MFKFIGTFIKKWFDKKSKPEHIVVLDKKPVFRPLPKSNPAYYHTKKRIKERYGYYISESLYNEWIDLIKQGKATYVKDAQGPARVYTVHLGNKNIIVVYDYEKQLIMTALPYNPVAVQQANKNKKSKGKASKNVGRGILN